MKVKKLESILASARLVPTPRGYSVFITGHILRDDGKELRNYPTIEAAEAAMAALPTANININWKVS